MEKTTVTFSNAGFVYDLANPTQQTEELSYILKQALLGMGTLYLRQDTDAEYQDRIDRDIERTDTLVTLSDNVAAVSGILAAPDNTIIDALADIAAASGQFIDSPGLAIIDKVELVTP